MPIFEKIAPFLTNPLVLVGFAIFLFYGLLRLILKAKLIPKLERQAGGQVIKDFLFYSFIIALVAIVLGFGIEAYKTFVGKQEHQRQIGRLETKLDNRNISDQLNREILVELASHFEHILLNPGGTAAALKESHKGFSWKHDYLSAAVLVKEARLLRRVTPLRGQVATLHMQHEDLVDLYESLRLGSGGQSQSDQQLSEELSEIVSLAWLARSYKGLANFVLGHQAAYETASKLAASGNASLAMDQLRTISVDLKKSNIAHSGGYYSHLGTLALAYNNKEEALSHFYKGMQIDREHIPLYEGLSFSLWALNYDVPNALFYAAGGLELIRQLKLKVTEACRLGYFEINGLLGDDPTHSKFYNARILLLDGICASLKEGTERYVQYFMETFKNLYAYFSAIILRNENEARTYANELHDTHPEDLDYAETAAFVAWRFARSRDDLMNAAQCLQVVSRRATDPFTLRIASFHYNLVLRRIRDLGFSPTIIPQAKDDSLARCRVPSHSSVHGLPDNR